MPELMTDAWNVMNPTQNETCEDILQRRISRRGLLKGALANAPLLMMGTALLKPRTAIAQQSSEVIAVYTLPDIPLGPFQNEVLPGTIENDLGFLLGSVGSGLWRNRGQDPSNEFWMATDRGPCGIVPGRRTFPVDAFTPWILRVRAEGDSITVLDKIPIVGQSATLTTGVGGLPNTSRDEIPWDCHAKTPLPFDPNGLDTEDIVRTRRGDFWLAEEYSPSIVHVDSTGRVVARFVPERLVLPDTDYPVVQALPGIYEMRRRNRGFEGIAITPNQHTLFAVLQSPLLNPDSGTGTRSRNTRLLAFDIRSERPVAEYVYRFQPSIEFGTDDPSEMSLSAVVALDPHRLLILERTETVAKIYRVDLRRATNILGSIWDDPATRPTLEALADPAEAGIVVLPKELVVDLSELPGVPDHIEGVALLDEWTIAISNDNDFEGTRFDRENCNPIPNGAKSQLLVIRLGASLDE